MNPLNQIIVNAAQNFASRLLDGHTDIIALREETVHRTQPANRIVNATFARRVRLNARGIAYRSRRFRKQTIAIRILEDIADAKIFNAAIRHHASFVAGVNVAVPVVSNLSDSRAARRTQVRIIDDVTPENFLQNNFRQ